MLRCDTYQRDRRTEFVPRSPSSDRSIFSVDSLASKLGIFNDFAIAEAREFYQTAGDHNFIEGKDAEKVAASCLYIACRVNALPILLFDFAAVLCVNLYELGVLYLQLCEVLNLKDRSFVQRLVDPSLFVHRYTIALLKEKNLSVSMAALRIIASINRDWICNGCSPSGLCGAAVYIAAIANGYSCGKSDVTGAVRVCQATLSKKLVEKLVEVGKAESESLTIEEFRRLAKEFEEEEVFKCPVFGENLQVLCQHKGEKPYEYGLCNTCYEEFVSLSRGLGSESDPSPLVRAKMETLIDSSENNTTGLFKKFRGVSGDVSDETEDLSDVNVDKYLNNEKETEFKKLMWELMNKKYIREEKLKKAAAAAGKARERSKKKQTQKKANAAAAAAAASKAADASKKRLSSKINYDALSKLFGDDDAPNPKRNCTEPVHGTDATEEECDKQETDGDENIGEDNEDVDEEAAYSHVWNSEYGDEAGYDNHYDYADNYNDYDAIDGF